MPRQLNLSAHIQKLVRDQKLHAEALAKAEKALAEIRTLLDVPTAAIAPAAGPAIPASPARTKRRKRGKFELTGMESLLAFIKQKGSPTTAEVKQHWASEGRGGKADNLLSLMAQAKKIKRTPLKDRPGSRYSLA